jgi:hypothetical protein
MFIEQAIMHQLKNTAAITALVPGGIHFVKAPQDTMNPYIAIQKVSDVPSHTHQGNAGLNNCRYQISCYAQTYATCKSITAAILAGLDSYAGIMGGTGGVYIGMCFLDNETDIGWDEDLRLFGVAVDYLISYT